MPRGGGDACIICSEIKCRCGRPPKPVRSKRRAAQPQVVSLPPVPPVAEPSSTADPWDDAPAPKQAAHAAMKSRAARSRGPEPARVIDHDATEDAIRALAPILHPDDRAKYGHLMSRHSEVSVRAAIWRQNHSS